MRIIEPSVTLEWITPDALDQIERAARTCYQSECTDSPRGQEEFIRSLIRRGHHSVLEHGVASLRIVCDRGVSHEIVRHRLASYSQASTRYCNYSQTRFGEEIQVIIPCTMKYDNQALWQSAMEESERVYLQLLRQGESPQVARSVLPTCLATELVMTANFREWRHFLALRRAPSAHPDMREIADKVKDILWAECPVVFE